MKYCSKCGVSNPEEAKFCRNCGCKLSSSGGGKLKLLLFAVVLILALAGFVVYCSHDERKPIVDNDYPIVNDSDSLSMDSDLADCGCMNLDLIDVDINYLGDNSVELNLDIVNNNIEDCWGTLEVRIKFYNEDNISPIKNENGDECEEVKQFPFSGNTSRETYSISLSGEYIEKLFYYSFGRSMEYLGEDDMISFDVILKDSYGVTIKRKNNYLINSSSFPAQ